MVSKSQEETIIKYGTQTELYLNVQFNKTGFKSVNVCPTDYFNYKKGDLVCFNLSQDVSVWYHINLLAGVTTLVILAVILFGYFVNYLFTNN